MGDNAWIGTGATILHGSAIGDGAVVAASVVVTKDIPSFEVWGGIPGRLIKKAIRPIAYIVGNPRFLLLCIGDGKKNENHAF